MIFFSTPGQILQLLNLHYIWHHGSVQRSSTGKNAADFCVQQKLGMDISKESFLVANSYTSIFNGCLGPSY